MIIGAHQNVINGTGVVSQAVHSQEEKEKNPDTFAEGAGSGEIPEGIHKKWLFLNYIAADCNLTETQLRNIDSQELAGSDDNTHIVAFIDVGPDPNPLDHTWSGARSYYITHDETMDAIKSPVIGEYGDHVNMVNPETLKNFLIDNIKKFPSDYVALVLNDHGSAFAGAMADVTEAGGKQLKIPQIRWALDEAQKVTGKKIDIIGFDACLMADTQVAYELKDNGNILLASEETEGASGWNYGPMLTDNITRAIRVLQEGMSQKLNVTPEEFARIVVRECEKHQDEIPTMSATDLTRMRDLAHAVNGLSEAILKTEEKPQVRAAIATSENFAGGWSFYRDIHDLHHIAEQIVHYATDPELLKEAQNTMKVVKEVVLANESSPTDHPNCHGLHIYAPTVSMSDFYTVMNYRSLQFGKDTKWADAVISLDKTPEHVTPGN